MTAKVVGTGWLRELERHPGDREALSFEGRSIDFAELLQAVKVTSHLLTAEGLSRGDRIGLIAPPSAPGVVLIHALLDLGIVMVPLNLRWTRSELRDAMQAARVDALVVGAEFEAVGREWAASSGCGLFRISPSTHSTGGLERISSLAPDKRAADSGPLTRARPDSDARDSALILFTSGTSGRPKGALLALPQLRASAEGSIALLGSDPDDRWLCCMPLFHIGGLSILTRSALAGTSVVLHRHFDPEAVSKTLEEESITRVSLVAAMLARLLEVRGERRAPRSLRLVLLGGGPASDELLMRAHVLGYPIAATYGLTEAASQVATRPPHSAHERPEPDLAAGLIPLPGTEIRIVAASGRSAKVGEVGEIDVRGPTVMRGYLDDPEATANVFRDGWLVTGDLGRLDAKGGLRVLDRRSDLIVSGGENVYPAEIESVLARHSDVAEAGVVGVADEVFGERPRAFVVAAPGRRIEIEELAEFCRERLARFKQPVDWVVLEELPRTASGKLLRRELKTRRDEPEN